MCLVCNVNVCRSYLCTYTMAKHIQLNGTISIFSTIKNITLSLPNRSLSIAYLLANATVKYLYKYQ